MIIVDEGAEAKLLSDLPKLRYDTEHARCIHFPAGGNERLSSVTQAAQAYLTSFSPRIYACADGDIFLIADPFPSREARRAMLHVAEKENIPADESFARLYELTQQMSALLGLVEQKIDKMHQQLEAQQRRLAERAAEQKRQSILAASTIAAPLTFDQRRRQRSEPQLLVIDDDVFSSKLVTNVVRQHYRIKAVDNPQQALSSYDELAPDLLFLDINLPNVSGHELLEKIMIRDPQAYVIMLSGNADLDNIRTAMTRGAKGFVSKPFTRDKLFQYIERCPTIQAGQEA